MRIAPHYIDHKTKKKDVTKKVVTIVQSNKYKNKQINFDKNEKSSR